MSTNVSIIVRACLISTLFSLVACGSSGSTPELPSSSSEASSSSSSETSSSASAPAMTAPDDPLEPHATVAEMGIGINLGNTLDAYPNEGDWALPAQERYLEDFNEAGFQHVRIPATWDDHTAQSAPYTVDSGRMNRAEEVVDWALDQGFYVILNAHHERWIWEGEGLTEEKRARFQAIWTQIAERFSGKSHRLIFEILNEPIGLSAEQTNELKADILPIIRAQNPTRLVIISGHNYSGVHTLSDIDLPEDDYLIANFHSYDPWAFAGQCTRRWGSEADRAELAQIYATAAAWREQSGVPVMLNEFGAAKFDFQNPENVCELEDRLAYIGHHVNLAIENGIPATFWDDGGSFSTYDREAGTWGPEKDVLVAPNNP
ncbi:glycoside hydrolase family 5 protein [Marinimicrobium koreense]|uniref:glycoside hydrolase family 5 protein n=1 Tax=Marinimicrobium koreense TaxID=306545 RepID=UPI003F719B35